MLARTSACRRVASTQLRARRRAHSHSHVCLPPRRRAHSHSHEHLDSPGDFNKRETGLPAHWRGRDWRRRAFTVGIGGPVGSGKTALTLQLCRALREKHAPVSNERGRGDDDELHLARYDTSSACIASISSSA